MRNATILVLRLRGVATEAIKNMVLAGIGKLIIVDGDSVTEEDLGAGFFFRDEDVGRKVGFSLPMRIFDGYYSANSLLHRDLTLPNQELRASIPLW